MDIDLERDWRRLAVKDDFGGLIPLAEAYDECLGRIGKPGTAFEGFSYFAKDGPGGRQIDCLKVDEDGYCVFLSCSGPGGFYEAPIGQFVFVA